MLSRKRLSLGWLSVLVVTLGLLVPTGPAGAQALNLPQDFLDLQAQVASQSPVTFPFPGDGLMGAPLSYVDNGDGTFTDLVTGRMWEIKVAGGSGSGTCLTVLHGMDLTCTWVQATGDWINAINAEGGTGYAGHNDWRAPNVRELQSLIDYSTSSPAVSAGFPGEVAASLYWSSTPSAIFASGAWVVNFSIGILGAGSKTDDGRVRAVRGGP